MTGDEKKSILNLLNTVSSWNYGYSSPDFKDFPELYDDFVEIAAEKKVSEQKLTSNSSDKEISSEKDLKNSSESEKITLTPEEARLAEILTKEMLKNAEISQDYSAVNNGEIPEFNKTSASAPITSSESSSVSSQNTGSDLMNNEISAQSPTSASTVQIPSEEQPATVLSPSEQTVSKPEEIASTQPQKKSNLTLESLSIKIGECKNCILSNCRTNIVPGEGVAHPLVMVIGERPDEDDDLTGRPFSGKTGQLLDKMLAAISLDRTLNCYLTNIVKCRPPKNRVPMPDEANACAGYLQAQIHILKPKYILAMGRCAVQSLVQTTEGLNSLRGKWLSYNGIPLIATYHPSELLQDPQLKAPAWEDLKIFRKTLMENYPKYDEIYRQKLLNASR